MRSRLVFPLLVLVLALAAPALRSGEAPEAVLERMAAVVMAGQTLEMDYVLVQYRNDRRVEARGMAQYHADGRRFVNQMKTQAGEKEVDVRMVCDGTIVWIEVREGEKIMAVQKFAAATLQKLGGASCQDPKGQVENFRARYTFSETRDGKLGDATMTVLEGTLKKEFIERQIQAAGELGGKLAAELAKPQLEAMVKARLYIEPATGRMRKTEVLDKDGQILVSFELEKVRQDVVLADSLFSYTPPKDIEVVDLDRLGAR
jgi:outer membrane lipoprotein-sorting protein